MGRVTTPKYVVETTENFRTKQIMPWRGPVTAARLAAWVAVYEASFAPGGVNAHASAGVAVHVSRAVVRENHTNGTVHATYNAPMFAIK